MTTPKAFGRYNLLEFLGKGAFAEVYRAEDTLLQRTVALKLLKPALLADEEALARFQREAIALASLTHPRIAWLWDMGEAEGRVFLSLRFVDGPSLAKRLAGAGPLGWEPARAILLQLAEALQFAHDRGLAHRDVKPHNVLVSPQEGAVLTDFGLAKALQSSGVTTTAGFVGTPAYMAPELWDGKEASPASDQYALACLLVEMLTGQPLFSGNTPAIMKRHLLEPPALPKSYPPGTPLNLSESLARALAKHPQERFADVQSFALALAASAPAQGIESKPPSPPAKEQDLLAVELAPGVSMEFVRVPASAFLMGSHAHDKEADEDEKPQHEVFLDEYWIGKTPVTNRQYQVFMKTTDREPPKHWKSIQVPKGKENHPVVYVSWQDAQDFCAWASAKAGQPIRLPSEAEWEKAARGTDGRRYPWGDARPTKKLCNYGNSLGTTSEVGKYSPQGDSPYGCADMAGNVWEWCADWYEETYYKKSPAENPQGPLRGEYRALRGGSWNPADGYYLRSANRHGYGPAFTSGYFGFRCARSP